MYTREKGIMRRFEKEILLRVLKEILMVLLGHVAGVRRPIQYISLMDAFKRNKDKI